MSAPKPLTHAIALSLFRFTRRIVWLSHVNSWSGASETQCGPIDGMFLPTRHVYTAGEAVVQEKCWVDSVPVPKAPFCRKILPIFRSTRRLTRLSHACS